MKHTKLVICTALAGALSGALLAHSPWVSPAAGQVLPRKEPIRRISPATDASLQTEVRRLRAQVAALQKIIQVADNGDVTIESGGTLLLRSRQLDTRSQLGTSIEATSKLRIKSSGVVDVDGSSIELN